MSQVYILYHDQIEVYTSKRGLCEGWKKYLKDYYGNPKECFDRMKHSVKVDADNLTKRYELSDEQKHDFLKFLSDESYEALFNVELLTEMEVVCHIYTAILDKDGSNTQRIIPRKLML